ncbi:MAG: 50S ribosomal protein L18 [Chloroflexota bacterium]|nr:50S ribosomal protein L18 [Chloroflexota bacterium]
MTATRLVARARRHARVRQRVRGTAERPRLAVFRSVTHIYAQLIDDVSRRTVAAASTLEAKDVTGSKIEGAKAVGTRLAGKAKAAGIAGVVFDRGGYRYHGRVRALAEAARSSGLEF